MKYFKIILFLFMPPIAFANISEENLYPVKKFNRLSVSYKKDMSLKVHLRFTNNFETKEIESPKDYFESHSLNLAYDVPIFVNDYENLVFSLGLGVTSLNPKKAPSSKTHFSKMEGNFIKALNDYFSLSSGFILSKYMDGPDIYTGKNVGYGLQAGVYLTLHERLRLELNHWAIRNTEAIEVRLISDQGEPFTEKSRISRTLSSTSLGVSFLF